MCIYFARERRGNLSFDKEHGGFCKAAREAVAAFGELEVRRQAGRLQA